jgi:hypothetical protein
MMFPKNFLPLAHKSAIYGEGSGPKRLPEGPYFREGIGHFQAQKSAIFGETFAGASRGLSAPMVIASCLESTFIT